MFGLMESLRNVNLNLLVAFSVLMQERNVSRAAKRMFMGQSGMSGALARLRELLDDPLLVRVGRRLEPTPRALELVEHVDRALATISDALAATHPFEPRSSVRTFTIGLTDDHEVLFTAALSEAMHQQAPTTRLVVRSIDVYSLRDMLDSGAVDAALSVASELPAWHQRKPLFEQGYACLWSPRQLGSFQRVTMRRYTKAAHAMVTFRGDLEGHVDTVLAERGTPRRVVVGVSRFSALPALLDSRPLIAIVPSIIASRFAHDFELRHAPPPFELRPRTVALIHRKLDDAQPELRWFRGLVQDVVARAVA